MYGPEGHIVEERDFVDEDETGEEKIDEDRKNETVVEILMNRSS